MAPPRVEFQTRFHAYIWVSRYFLLGVVLNLAMACWAGEVVDDSAVPDGGGASLATDCSLINKYARLMIGRYE
jgi:hypothetical protein